MNTLTCMNTYKIEWILHFHVLAKVLSFIKAGVYTLVKDGFQLCMPCTQFEQLGVYTIVQDGFQLCMPCTDGTKLSTW